MKLGGGILEFRTGLLLAFMLAALLAGPSSDARVFLRRAYPRGRIDPVQLGWRTAWTGSLELDGAAWSTQIFASGSGPRASLKRLESYFENRGARFASGAGAELGWGLAVEPNRRTHVLVLAPSVLRNALVFVFHRTGNPGRRPDMNVLSDLPRFPGAELLRTVARSESGLRLGFFETPATAGEVLDFYEGVLPGNGWQALISDRAGRSLPRSLLLYQKGKRLCCISIKSSGAGAPNLITILIRDT